MFLKNKINLDTYFYSGRYFLIHYLNVSDWNVQISMFIIHWFANWEAMVHWRSFTNQLVRHLNQMMKFILIKNKNNQNIIDKYCLKLHNNWGLELIVHKNMILKVLINTELGREPIQFFKGRSELWSWPTFNTSKKILLL